MIVTSILHVEVSGCHVIQFDTTFLIVRSRIILKLLLVLNRVIKIGYNTIGLVKTSFLLLLRKNVNSGRHLNTM